MTEERQKTIIQDKRDIREICVVDDYQSCNYHVGRNGVSKIVPYEESGEMAGITWVAVYIKLPAGEEVIVSRIPTRYLQITY